MLTGHVLLEGNMLVEAGAHIDVRRDTSLWLRYVLPYEVLITDVAGVYDLLAGACVDLVVDCGECVSADPGLLSALVNARQHAKRQEAVVQLENVGASMAQLLRMTGLHTVFEMDEASRKFCEEWKSAAFDHEAASLDY